MAGPFVCKVCAKIIYRPGPGHPPSYCSPTCRWKANSQRNAETIRRCGERYRAANRERKRVYDRAHYSANAERITAQVRAYRARPEKAELLRLFYKRWKQENIEQVRENGRQYAHRRRARLAGAPTFLITDRQLQRVLARFRGACAYCGAPADQWDHVIPLSRNGRHSIGNLLPACGDCNNYKNAKLLMEWRRSATWPSRSQSS